MTPRDWKPAELRLVAPPKLRTVEICEAPGSPEAGCQTCFGCLVLGQVGNLLEAVRHEQARVDVLTKRLRKLEAAEWLSARLREKEAAK